MKRTVTLVSLLVLAAGCESKLPAPSFVEGQKDQSAGSASMVRAEPNSPHSPAASAGISHRDTSRPEVAVKIFPDALQQGDDETADQLLTDRAQQATSSQNLEINPPGSQTAQYVIGQVEYVTKNMDGAHVDSTWSDVDEQGNRAEHRIIWVLRLETTGWRVAGLATSLVEGDPPLFLNFEDPEDFDRKRREAEAKMAQQLANQQAQSAPENTTSTRPSDSRPTSTITR